MALYHGMRSKESIETIKKKGFCSYGSPVDEKRAIFDALRFFNKEKILQSNSRKGNLVRSIVNEITEKTYKGRLSTYATTSETAPCDWWARANPEHISLALSHSGVSEENINKYLDEIYGECYRVELNLNLTDTQKKQLSYGSSINFNTNKRCILPSEIKEVKKCKTCNYSFKSVENNL